MSNSKFSLALFEQLGGTNWSLRSEADFVSLSKAELTHAVIDEASRIVVEAPFKAVVNLNEGRESSGVSSVLDSGSRMNANPVLESQERTSTEPKTREIIVLGSGLDSVWQNESNQCWLLWQNIMLTFGWDESYVTFYDTAHLASEEMVFTTMEEIIEQGVDWVLTMDESHSISEQLVEGVHVVTVPDLESMLFDPYSKQAFYQSVVALSPVSR
ncbi:MAG: hypothetical protein GXO35_04110 [Gammaproteobacteria bacterium]|nr:hypothetical protein [Gammaproteobacteria bacterium]